MSIRNLKLPKKSRQVHAPGAGPITLSGRKLGLENYRNPSGTLSAQPLGGQAIDDGKFAGVLVAIMKTMGFDELRISEHLLRDDYDALDVIDVERDARACEIVIRKRARPRTAAERAADRLKQGF